MLRDMTQEQDPTSMMNPEDVFLKQNIGEKTRYQPDFKNRGQKRAREDDDYKTSNKKANIARINKKRTEKRDTNPRRKKKMKPATEQDRLMDAQRKIGAMALKSKNDLAEVDRMDKRREDRLKQEQQVHRIPR
ncbi:hypothetical protein TL16_g05317 [Triparma laevis f. inornata]|uniref:Uncharacterized protein n=1 Tax=Triparma laevis f. inornata TaxID=1714386 RepID=A0A9W7AHK4_9STRA|nr:hypothetical protein TL16_g05317 [Triparma laevis f. inornata]